MFGTIKKEEAIPLSFFLRICLNICITYTYMKKIFFVLASILIVLPLQSALAVTVTTDAGSQSAGTVQLVNPLGGTVDSPQQLIGRVIDAALGIVGSIALLMFIWGGFTWMTSAGNEKRVSEGRAIVMWAAMGLVMIFMSYALVKFVLKDVIGA
jgi:hypothetical protein